MATLLPFSTSGGSSSLILPAFTVASPTIWRIACFIEAGVALAGRTASAKPAPAAAARNWRRLAVAVDALISVFQRLQIGYDVLDLPGRQHRLAAIILRHAGQAVDPIIRRHDGSRIEAGGVNQPEPQLALRPAGAGALQARRQVALEALLRKRAGVAQQARALAPDYDGAAALGIARRAGQRLRNGVADH